MSHRISANAASGRAISRASRARKARRFRRPVSASWVASWRSLTAWSTDWSAATAWFANSRSAWRRARVGSSRSRGSSTQISPRLRPCGSASGTISQWRDQAFGPRPYSSESRSGALPAEALVGDLGGHEVAAGDLELVREQRRERVERHRRARAPVSVPAAGRVRLERHVGPGGQLDHDRLEAERVTDSVADRLEDALGILFLGHLRRHLEDPLEHALMLDVVGGVLRHPQRERRVAGDGHEGVHLVVIRPPAALRLVHGDHPDQEPLRVAQRHEQRILCPPGILLARREARHVAVGAERLPVEFAAGTK